MRSDKGVSRPHYDNSRRAVKAKHDEYSLLVQNMLDQMEKQERIHPATYEDAMVFVEKAFTALDTVLLHLKRAERTFNETPRVRNQRLKRRRSNG